MATATYPREAYAWNKLNYQTVRSDYKVKTGDDQGLSEKHLPRAMAVTTLCTSWCYAGKQQLAFFDDWYLSSSKSAQASALALLTTHEITKSEFYAQNQQICMWKEYANCTGAWVREPNVLYILYKKRKYANCDREKIIECKRPHTSVIK